MSPSSFSRYISQAETYAGQTLFERTGKGVAPTSAGRAFLAMLDRLQEAVGQFEASAERLRESGPEVISIGCGPLAARSIVSPLLSEAFNAHPGLRAKVQVTSSKKPLEALRTGELDLAVSDLTHTSDLANLEVQLLRKRSVSFWARPEHPIFKRATVSVSDVFRFPFATSYLPNFWRKQIALVLGGTKSDVETAAKLPHFESDDFSFLASMATTSDLICGGMEEDYRHHGRLGLLRKIDTHDSMTWNLCVARREGASFPALDMFWARICREYAQSAF